MFLQPGEPRTAATSKMEHFVRIVNGWKLLTIITKRSILDVAVVLDPPLRMQTKSLRCFKSPLQYFDVSLVLNSLAKFHN